MSMNKRGVSAVVATILIILLVIVGVTILWAAVRPTIEQTTKQINAACITIDLEIKACDLLGDPNTVTIKRNIGEGNLGGIKLIVDGTPCDTESVTLNELESSSGSNCTISSSTDDIPDFTNKEIEIAAVLSGGQLCAPLRNPFTCL